MKYKQYQTVVVDLDSIDARDIYSNADLDELQERGENLFFIYEANSAKIEYYTGATYVPLPIAVEYDMYDDTILGVAPDGEYECEYKAGPNYFSCPCVLKNGFISKIYNSDISTWEEPDDDFLSVVLVVHQAGIPKRLEGVKKPEYKAGSIQIKSGKLELEETLFQ